MAQIAAEAKLPAIKHLHSQLSSQGGTAARGCQINLSKDPEPVNTAPWPKRWGKIGTQNCSVLKCVGGKSLSRPQLLSTVCSVRAVELTVKERNSRGPQEQDRASSQLGRRLRCDHHPIGGATPPLSCLLLPPSKPCPVTDEPSDSRTQQPAIEHSPVICQCPWWRFTLSRAPRVARTFTHTLALSHFTSIGGIGARNASSCLGNASDTCCRCLCVPRLCFCKSLVRFVQNARYLRATPQIDCPFLPCLLPPPLSLSSLMDGQIMYIQSSSAPDAVRGCDKSPGREPSRAERRNGVTKRTRHLENTQKKKNAPASRAAYNVCTAPRAHVCVCVLFVENKHTPYTLPFLLLCGLTVQNQWLLHSTPANIDDENE
ncbi:uncharacterized protein LOC118563424 [Fundulus heteroclitus]|uniref:uncharacterized protein LOC118563424 n=1 Tax=Fundulus heteroclitus TaxID=8078 RepID=UPI00165AD3DA|nr:uncharacterized protein LOC118563424 [Fundulus heteroclitus]